MDKKTNIILSSLPGTVTSFAGGIYLNSRINELNNTIEEYKKRVHESIELIKKLLILDTQYKNLSSTTQKIIDIIEDQKTEINKLKEENKYNKLLIKNLYENISILSEKIGLVMIDIPKKKSSKKKSSKKR